jgi:hypothetical protein
MEVLFRCFQGGVGLLQVFHGFAEFLCIDFGYVLNHDCDVLGVMFTCKFLVVGSVFEYDCLA